MQLGCGPGATKTAWIDCDGSWNARANGLPGPIQAMLRTVSKMIGGGATAFPAHVRYVDLRSRLPFADESVDAVYASHVWEHLHWDVAEAATRECFRILRPGGRIRLIVPDLRERIDAYRNDADPQAALTLQKHLLFHPMTRQGNPLYRVYQALTEFHFHKVMYDFKLMADLLVRSGFREPGQCGYLESAIPEIQDVEKATRVGSGLGFATEAVK